jgi:hypothetical protein
MSKQARIGGTFAPPVDESILVSYHNAIIQMPDSQVKEYLTKVYECVAAWWNLPESGGEGTPHPSGRGIIVDLSEDVKKELWDLIPWQEELNIISSVFDGLPSGSVRNMAFHLLWFVNELNLDRDE